MNISMIVHILPPNVVEQVTIPHVYNVITAVIDSIDIIY